MISVRIPDRYRDFLRLGTCSWKYDSWKSLLYDEDKAYRTDDYLVDYARFLILGASSDHLIAVSNTAELQVGDEVRFDVDYGAMLAAMTSLYVQKVHLNRDLA
jgi:hypothetical protein